MNTSVRKLVFLANNPDTPDILDTLSIHEDDILVIFNNCRYLEDHPVVKKHSRIYYCYRTCTKLFNSNFVNSIRTTCVDYKIIFFPAVFPLQDGASHLSMNQASREKLKSHGFTEDGPHCPQTGLLAYLYLQSITDNFNDLNVFLIGFTNTYRGKIISGFHDGKKEQEFFRDECRENGNIIKIDSLQDI